MIKSSEMAQIWPTIKHIHNFTRARNEICNCFGCVAVWQVYLIKALQFSYQVQRKERNCVYVYICRTHITPLFLLLFTNCSTHNRHPLRKENPTTGIEMTICIKLNAYCIPYCIMYLNTYKLVCLYEMSISVNANNTIILTKTKIKHVTNSLWIIEDNDTIIIYCLYCCWIKGILEKMRTWFETSVWRAIKSLYFMDWLSVGSLKITPKLIHSY